jgi:hypothetical protein
MKKIVSILVLVFAVTFTTQAQKKRGEKGSKLTVEQHTTLAVKKMTLALDLSDKQQKQIKPLLMAKMTERKASMEKKKEARGNKERPTADEMYAKQIARLDNQIAMKNKMKNILNKEQFEKFEKMQKGRKKMAMKSEKGSKKNKGDKRGERPQQGK